MKASEHEDFDLAWLACRYVSRDLAGAELTRFEERLAADQTARETVADVVDLCAAIEALPRQAFLPSSRGARVWPAVGWMSLGAAACLALMLGLQSALRGPALPHVTQGENDAAGDQRLALSWTTQNWVDSNLSTGAEELPVSDASDSAADTDSGEAESNETHENVNLEPPSWVKAAIDESARPIPQSSPSSEESN